MQSDGRYVAWNREEEDTGTAVWVYDTKTNRTIDQGGTWPSIDDSRVAWLRFSQWGDQPPAVDGGHVVWARRNSDSRSSEGRGTFVATAPANPYSRLR